MPIENYKRTITIDTYIHNTCHFTRVQNKFNFRTQTPGTESKNKQKKKRSQTTWQDRNKMANEQ